MGLLIGPTPWWQQNVITVSPVGTILPDRSAIICKAGGTAWIVAPASTQVGQTWTNGAFSNVGNKPCVCDWTTLCARMISCGFNPGDWFVPSSAQLQNPGCVCRTRWDSFSATFYWSATQVNNTNGCIVSFTGSGVSCVNNKGYICCVRAFRCVTY